MENYWGFAACKNSAWKSALFLGSQWSGACKSQGDALLQINLVLRDSEPLMLHKTTDKKKSKEHVLLLDRALALKVKHLLQFCSPDVYSLSAVP